MRKKSPSTPCGFNEAAAIRCGSHAQEHPVAAGALLASMRPQRFAADHLQQLNAVRLAAGRFNEAAAIRCGSQSRRGIDMSHLEASMRPQRFAADH